MKTKKIFILKLCKSGKLLVFLKTNFKWVLNDSKGNINVKIGGGKHVHNIQSTGLPQVANIG